MWMGVPVVSLSGNTHASRAGVSLLTTAGLKELAVETEDRYVAAAAALASDLPKLADLRRGLRDRVAASPLCDGPRIARAMEEAYRHMWRESRNRQ
jgi:predicted O-linked N-acetylglucosamine transferase (SPINDLY family)